MIVTVNQKKSHTGDAPGGPRGHMPTKKSDEANKARSRALLLPAGRGYVVLG
jgi:hypothetical protein